MKKIPIQELVFRLSKARREKLYIAIKDDYNCYEMTGNYDVDQKNDKHLIGYNYNRPRNGVQFVPVCIIEKGKITKIDFTLCQDTINLAQLYIDNVRGFNIIDPLPEEDFVELELPYSLE